MSRMIIIDPGLKLWGSERALLATIPLLIEAHSYVCAIIPNGAELAKELRAGGVTVFERSIGFLHRASTLARVGAAISILMVCIKERVDLIYLNQAGFCRIAYSVACILGVRCVIHVRILEDIPRVAALKPNKRSPLALIFISHDMFGKFQAIAGRDAVANRTEVVAYDIFEVEPERGTAPA